MKFGAEWCQPCKSLSELIKSTDLKGTTVQEINIDTNLELVKQYNVRSIPLLIMFDTQGTEVSRAASIKTKAQLDLFLNQE